MFVLAAAPFAAGCGLSAPFNELSGNQTTVMKLQGQEAPAPAANAAIPGLPTIPGLPPIPPEWQQGLQAAAQGLQQVLPPGLIPPGLIPGVGPQQPNQSQMPRFKNFVVLAQMPMTDEEAQGELLDIFGHEANFSSEKGQCFAPGMGISIQRPNQPPVDLLVSLSCNQVMCDGFKWPYAVNGLTSDSRQRLTKIYEKMWGPVPPGA